VDELTRTTTQADSKRLLREAKLRVTSVRLGVVEVLAKSDEALDAADVFAQLHAAATDRVTVYRTLNALVEAGLAHKVDPGDRRFRYRLTSHEHCSEDHHDHEHPHLVCDSCGKVECMDDAEVLIRRRAGREGSAWHVKQQSVTVHGTCGRCDEGTAKAGRRGRARRS
jgi:Fur family transcriptional regulator, ferric uptake regulator